MLYVIIQKEDKECIPVLDQVFKTEEEANIERIYLQPDYDSLLEIEPII